MKGFLLFISLFNTYGEREKKVILRNIFSVKDVSTYDFYACNNRIYFRVYYGNVFYQYVFHLDSNDFKYCVKKEEGSIVLCDIWVKNYVKGEYDYSIDILTRLFISGDINEIKTFINRVLRDLK